MPEVNLNPIDKWAAVKATIETVGWKLLIQDYSKEGDELLAKILDENVSNIPTMGMRDLYVYQLNALGKLSKVVEQIRLDAEAEKDRQEHHG